MFRSSDGGLQPSARLRRWAIRIAVVCLVLEVAYVIVGNLCIRMGVVENALNFRPEENFVSWESGFTSFPGFFSLRGFTYRGQTLGGQIYLHLAELEARISLPRLVFKTVRIKGVRGRDLDYRYRERIDYPCWSEESGVPFPGIPEALEWYPEIPGIENPPNPKPEDLYSREAEDRPWTIEISGARVRGAVHAAYNETRLEGEGTVRGGVTAVLKESSAVNRVRVRLAPATLRWGPRVLTDDLGLEVDIRVEPFPAECSEISQILDATTGKLVVTGNDSRGFNVNVNAFQPLLPGQGVLTLESGVGELSGRLEFSKGTVSSGQIDLVADDVVLKQQEDPLHGDLAVHLILAAADLSSGRYDISGTTFRLDDIAKIASSEKQQQKLEPWYCHLEFEEGTVTLDQPVRLDSHVRLQMHDTRPMLVLLRKFTNELKWLTLTRNAKGVDGTMDLDLGEGFVAFENLRLFGEDVEILGWVHIRDGEKYGRVFARHGARSAGIAFEGGRGKVVTVGSRKWFDKQPGGPHGHGGDE